MPGDDQFVRIRRILDGEPMGRDKVGANLPRAHKTKKFLHVAALSVQRT